MTGGGPPTRKCPDPFESEVVKKFRHRESNQNRYLCKCFSNKLANKQVSF
jgi:hypothetical protein